ncbi:hypothetical protein NDU88_004118, partial [Pleurodeles waltl]
VKRQDMARTTDGQATEESSMSAASGSVTCGGWRCTVPQTSLQSLHALYAPSATPICQKHK